MLTSASTVSKHGGEGKRQTERDGQRERQTHGKTDRQTETSKERAKCPKKSRKYVWIQTHFLRFNGSLLAILLTFD